MWVRALVIAGLVTACNRDSTIDDTTSTSTTAAVSDTTTTEGAATTYAGPDACMSTDECGSGKFCAAAYDPGTATRGPAACVNTCVPADDLTLWCFDDRACCDGLRCNPVDGFCHPHGSDETSGTTQGDTDASGDTTTTEGTTTEGTTAEGTTETGSSTTGDTDSTSSTGDEDSTSTGSTSSTSE
jgi:hypothetical protein